MAIDCKMASADDAIIISSDEDEVSSSTEAAKRNSLLLSLQRQIMDTWSEMDKRGAKVVVKTEKDVSEHEVTSATSLGQPEAVSVLLTQSMANIKEEYASDAEQSIDNQVSSQNKVEGYASSDETVVFSDDPTTYELFPRKHESKDSTPMQAGTSYENEWNVIKMAVEKKYTAANETITPTEMELFRSTLMKLYKPEEGATTTNTSNRDIDTGNSTDKQLSQLKALTIPLVRIDAKTDSDGNAQNGESKYIIALDST